MHPIDRVCCGCYHEMPIRELCGVCLAVPSPEQRTPRYLRIQTQREFRTLRLTPILNLSNEIERLLSAIPAINVQLSRNEIECGLPERSVPD
jgi:hypothetical protein